MQAIVGGQRVQVQAAPDTTLGILLDQIERDVNRRREVVTRVRVDGREIDLTISGDQVCDEVLSGNEQIEVEVETASQAIAESLEEARSTMPNLLSRIEEVTSVLQTGARPEAFTVFAGCLDHWRSVVHLLQIAADLLRLREGSIELRGRTLRMMNEELLSRLEEAKEAMEREDLVGLSDVLEYEIRPRIREEVEVIDRMIELAKNRVIP